MFMEMRWVPAGMAKSMSSECIVAEDHLHRVLQYRTREVDDGFYSGFGKWSDWIDVPTVTAET